MVTLYYTRQGNPGTGSDPNRQNHARDKNVSPNPDITINVIHRIA